MGSRLSGNAKQTGIFFYVFIKGDAMKMRHGRMIPKVVLFIGCLAFLCGSALAAGKTTLLMATTTSTDNTGLLDYLAPHFEKATGINLRWTATGTGKALTLGQNCDVDVLLVHAPAAEMKFVKEGYGINRRQIMYNDFVLIGPPSDPAGIKGQSVAAAMTAIAAKQAVFVSRGDNSGTNKKELQLWKLANQKQPDKESWYVQTGQGMLATINVTEERNGYTLTDRGTYIKYESNKGGHPPLVILVEGDPALRNQYSVIEIPKKRCPKAKQALAHRFSEWMASPQTQKLIGDFKLMGKQLFIPNAK
jgi:tungstate transport system substrate-binding protein